MRDDVKLSDWILDAAGPPGDSFLESVFFTGNGRMGARGYSSFRPWSRPAETGLFIAGMFDEFKPGITDFVNLPTPLWMEILTDGSPPAPPETVKHRLDMACGLLTFSYVLPCGGKSLRVTEERLFPMHMPSAVLQRFSFKADSGMYLTLKAGVELSCRNRPVHDDQVKKNTETVRLVGLDAPLFGENRLDMTGRTRHTGLSFRQQITFAPCDFEQTGRFYDEDKTAGLRYDLQARAGAVYYFEQAAEITTSRDVDPLIAPLGGADLSWREACEKNAGDWRAYWRDADIRIDGDDKAQTALRYAAFQLRCNCSARDGTVSIGARGLTHTRYKGCYFWDTDFFMMPFFLLTKPEAARSLMQYRVNTLPQAKEHAKKMNGGGARFPWMASYDGSEQCETWDIGCSEVHVTADIAYAAGQYLAFTGDEGFFLEGGGALLIETARFWMTRYSPDPEKGGVKLLWCKGPDEYCGVTSNNLFTNRMVQHNMALAVGAAGALKEKDRGQYRALGLSDGECLRWRAFMDAIPLPRDPESGRYRTDDTFHLLEPVEPSSIKNSDEASYNNICFDRLQRYKVIKQADVLLLMSRLPQAFSAAEKLDAWEDFEPLCLHDSTLSFASHALFAFQNGLVGPGEAYLEKALLLDLLDIMGNTGHEGLHLAGMGEGWQALVFGVAGLRIDGGKPCLRPNLPSRWKKLSFRIKYLGVAYSVSITREEALIERAQA